MILMGRNLLNSLKNVRWKVLARTYGNSHSTLIGLLVDWWISMSPEYHSALEGGPTNGYEKKGVRGQCDAMLCYKNDPVGVLEVEGSRYGETARKIGRFFDAKKVNYKSLKFGILLLYSEIFSSFSFIQVSLSYVHSNPCKVALFCLF